MSNAQQSAPAPKPEENKTNLPATVDNTVSRDLFNIDLFVNSPEVTRGFGLKPILSKGTKVGGRMALDKRSEIAKEFNLEGKENADKLDEKMRELELEAWKRTKAWLLMQPDDLIGLRVFATRTVKGGSKRHSLTLDELPPRELAAMQKLADAFGVSLEEIQKRMAGAKPSPVVDVKATQSK